MRDYGDNKASSHTVDPNFKQGQMIVYKLGIGV